MAKERCAACGDLFESEPCVYGGSDYCSTCRPSRQEKMIEAREEATKEFGKLHTRHIADQKAMDFTEKLGKEMADRDRKNPNARRW